MNTEDELKRAKELLKQVSTKTDFHPLHDVLKEINEFLQADIEFEKMPVGTNLLIDGNSGYTFNAEYSDKSILVGGRDHSILKSHVSLPGYQLSHIHKIKWPDSEKRPDFVEYNDTVILSESDDGTELYSMIAGLVNWDKKRAWFGIINVTEYCKL